MRTEPAVLTLTDFAIEQCVEVIENVMQESGPRSECAEFGLETDQPARRNHVVEAYATFTIGLHAGELSTEFAERLHHRTLRAFIEIDGERFERLALFAVDLLHDNSWTRYRELIAFPTHVLAQQPQRQLASTVDAEFVRVVCFLYAQRDVMHDLT